MDLDGSVSWRRKLEREGWKSFVGEARRMDGKEHQGGVMTFSRWRMKMAKSGAAKGNPDRVVVTHLEIKGRRPVRLSNMYLKSGDAGEVCRLGEMVMLESIAECDQAIIIGDWNRTTLEAPVAEWVACNEFHIADDVLAHSEWVPTHKERHIDHAVFTGIFPIERE